MCHLNVRLALLFRLVSMRISITFGGGSPREIDFRMKA